MSVKASSSLDHDALDGSLSAENLARLLQSEAGAQVLYPTDEQVLIIEAPLQPLLVLAGAGSGKTKTMADRVVWLVANKLVRPEQILGVTFTRKAAGELAARIRQQLAALYRAQGEAETDTLDEHLEPSISTYHSYANGIVQDYGLRIGVERDAVMLGSAQSWQLASRIVESHTGAWEHITAAKSTLTNAVLTMASECAEHLVEPAKVRRALVEHIDAIGVRQFQAGKTKPPTQGVEKLLNKLRTRITVTELVERYSAAKQQGGQLDFGDLVSLAARIVSEVPEAVQVERQKYAVILLDEFQDTSHAQMVLFSRLFGDGRSVTAVGDPHQSIYGFRGASAGQLGTFRTRFPISRPDTLTPAPVVNLSVAWRNSTSILAAANAVSSPLNVPPPWIGEQHRLEVPRLQPRPKAPRGEVYLARYLSESASDAQPASHPTDPMSDEASALTRIIEAQRRRSFDVDEAGSLLRPTIAVLCRGRRQFEALRRALTSAGLPVQIIGLGGLLRTPEVIEILSVLRVLGDPERSDAMMRLLAGARWRLGSADLMALGDWARQLAHDRDVRLNELRTRSEAAQSTGDELKREEDAGPSGSTPAPIEESQPASLVDSVDHLPPPGWVSGNGRSLSEAARSRLIRLRNELRRLRESVGDDLHTLIGEIEQTLLLDIELAAKPGVSIHEARRNLDAFADAVSGFVSTSERVDLPAFLAWLEAADAEEDGLPVTALETSRESVQLLTVHAAKGLEWDVVVVPGMNEGAFPSGSDSRWSSGDAAIPWPLRGDAAELPQWDWDQPDQKTWLESEKLFAEDAGSHTEREERRLAYVALTRARHVLVCSSSAWGGGRAKPTAPSSYLEQLRELAAAGERGYTELAWIQDSEVGDSNPARAASERAAWPTDPLGMRRNAMEEAAAAVITAAEQRKSIGQHHSTNQAQSRWAEEVRKALARASERRSVAPVELPTHISASLMVELAEDSSAVARRLRRPVPRRPGTAARRGTAFHAWIEEYYGATGMLDLGEFPGAADTFVDQGLGLEALTDNFKRSSWAARAPHDIEIPVETRVDALVVRGRIDAVFQDDDGSWDLIDWKTGRPPGPRDRDAKAVQLAVYRLAWSRLLDVPLRSVRAAFYYVSDDVLVRPHDLADSDALERIIRRATAGASASHAQGSGQRQE
ncbi:DNA helicase-2/ATP-dependent DNA helicase PcrA [Arthrobacter pigmenti]|uniref:DNA 3'-5' helicase n=1 Tax=Arthrobacter pigmenti TaxID=271432 RepID=A0A846RI82_9MICC|nr:ATP-dependent DNA helicase [Arthrobacter pigmenti]NJC22978.1 DNA helicase-2/ATP-dependent DNA helicase PcrA [Arthrobacter pigmenti]